MRLTQAFLALAQARPDELSPLAELIVLCVALLVVLVIMILFLRSVRARYKGLHDRSMEHMERMEAKTDEMIHLLREIGDRLDRGGS